MAFNTSQVVRNTCRATGKLSKWSRICSGIQKTSIAMSLLSYRAIPLSWAQQNWAWKTASNLGPPDSQDTHATMAISEKIQREGWEVQRQAERELWFVTSHEDLPSIPNNTEVWITTESVLVSGRVISPAGWPRSYLVETPSAQVERNLRQLTIAPSENSENSENSGTNQQSEVDNATPRRIMTQSRTGTAVNPPNWLYMSGVKHHPLCERGVSWSPLLA